MHLNRQKGGCILKRYAKQINRVCHSFFLCFILVIIVGIAIEGAVGRSAFQMYDTERLSLDNWQYEDGTQADLSLLRSGDVTVTHDVTGYHFTHRRLCLKSIDVFFDVYAGEEQIYHFHPTQASAYGKSYGRYVHEIIVPEDTRELRIEVFPIFSEYPAAFSDVMVMDGGAYIAEAYNQGMSNFGASLVMMTCGLVLILINLIRNYQLHSHSMEFATLGTFSWLVALWGVNDAYIMQMLTESPALVQVSSYIALILLPYPGLSFLASATKRPQSKVTTAFLAIVMLHLFAAFFCSVFGIRDFIQFTPIMQLLCLAALAIGCWMIVDAGVKKTIDRHYFFILGVGVITLIFGIVVDVIRYKLHVNTELGSGYFTRVAAMIFLALVGFHLLQQYTQMRMDKDRAEVKAQLAYVDGLTGMHNRLAFNEKEKNLSKCPMCMIIQLDINFLKTVNDVHGHQEGDKHITNAARIISDSFGKQGECFRTGGDEFVCIIEGHDCKFRAEAALVEMKKLINEYNRLENPPVKLQIASGSAVYRSTFGSLDETEKLADERMYENKRRLKAMA